MPVPRGTKETPAQQDRQDPLERQALRERLVRKAFKALKAFKAFKAPKATKAMQGRLSRRPYLPIIRMA